MSILSRLTEVAEKLRPSENPTAVIAATRAKLDKYLKIDTKAWVNFLEQNLGTNNLVELNSKTSGAAVSLARTTENGMTYKVTVNTPNTNLQVWLDKNGQVFETPAILKTVSESANKVAGVMGLNGPKLSTVQPATDKTVQLIAEQLEEFRVA